MIQHVEFIQDKALKRFGKESKSKIVNEVLSELKRWDYLHNYESNMAVLFHIWEREVYRNMHSWKIRSEYTRLALAAPHTYDDWLYLEIEAWKDHSKAT